MAGIQKSLKKFETKNYGIQSAIQKFWYMSGIQAKKSHMKSYTDLFSCRDLLAHWLCFLLPDLCASILQSVCLHHHHLSVTNKQFYTFLKIQKTRGTEEPFFLGYGLHDQGHPHLTAPTFHPYNPQVGSCPCHQYPQ